MRVAQWRIVAPATLLSSPACPAVSRSRLGASPRIGDGRAHGACEASSRREEESMPSTSSTTSNADIARNPHAPFGFRRRGGIRVVGAPRRWTRHRLRRAAWHLPPRRSERGRLQFSDRLQVPIVARRSFQSLLLRHRLAARSRPGCFVILCRNYRTINYDNESVTLGIV